MNSTLKRLLLSVATGAMLFGLSANPARATAISLAQLAGTFDLTGGGSVSVCVDATTPSLTTPVACDNDGDEVTAGKPASVLGEYTEDTSGNFCGSFTVTESDYFSIIFFATVATQVQTVTLVGTNQDYNPNTGIGDWSMNEFTEGSCVGALFIPAGSSFLDTQTIHSIAANRGALVNSILTSDSSGAIQSFSITLAANKRQ